MWKVFDSKLRVVTPGSTDSAELQEMQLFLSFATVSLDNDTLQRGLLNGPLKVAKSKNSSSNRFGRATWVPEKSERNADIGD